MLHPLAAGNAQSCIVSIRIQDGVAQRAPHIHDGLDHAQARPQLRHKDINNKI